MLETSRLWPIVFGVVAAACANPGPQAVEAPAAPAAPVVATPAKDDAALAEEAKALLAQAETDVQRARAKRALWLKAWEDLLSARRAVAAGNSSDAIRYAKQASELAQLGLEQLAYPAVK
ncbi:MAG TPA: hypothetical protein VKR38_00570 [Usitatibacter sp.]|nr:hypothetical protein [Usitatibacter sp.]